ncbi:MAG: glutathione S-transferase C-terminal domain-containing protein, partial [Pseudomonadota bacterium]
EADGPFKHHLDRYKYATRYDGAVAEEHRTAGGEFLMKLDARLGEAPFLGGSRPGLADMAIAPFVRQFANTDREWFDVQPWVNLRRWLEAFLASDRFQRIMEKHPVWATSD